MTLGEDGTTSPLGSPLQMGRLSPPKPKPRPEENRRNIYETDLGSWRANRRMAASFLFMFLGILAGFASWRGP